MKLGIVARADDAQALHTAAVARAAGHDAVIVDFAAMIGAVPVSFPAWHVAGLDLATCDAFVIRQVPAATAMLAPADETATSHDWYRRGKKQSERSTFAHAALMDLELRGKPMANPLLASSPFDHKPLQLAVFDRAGLPIPRTLVTNDVAAARAFCVVDAVAKPAAGGAAAVAVDDALWSRFDASAPAIFQHRIRGDDVRVTVVGGSVVSAVVVTIDGDDAVDYRTAAVQYAPHALPDDVSALCVRAASLCRHEISGVDLKRAGDGYALLEANSAPVYLDIELATGAPITRALVDHVAALVAR